MKKKLAVLIIVFLVVSLFTIVDAAAANAANPIKTDKPLKEVKADKPQKAEKDPKPPKAEKAHKPPKVDKDS